MANVRTEQVDFLIVDDDQRICDMLTGYFQARGHTAVSLREPAKLLPWLALNSCSALTLDIDMPGVDGLTLLRQVREAHPALPVVMFTGAGYDKTKMETAIASGAKGYVSKGLPASEIHAAVLRALGQSAN